MATSLYTAPLTSITDKDVLDFISLKEEEGPRLDYKEAEKNSNGPPQKMIDVIVAFANTQGGLLILGVEADDQTNKPIKWDGLTYPKRGSLEEIITSRCYSRIIPPLAPEIRVCPFKSDQSLPDDDRAFVVIRVHQSAVVHSTNDNRVLIRVNSECQNAPLMTLRFLLEREQKQEEAIKQRSMQVLDGYWAARQLFIPEFSQPEWKSFRDRIYMEFVPLDSPTDALLPFGMYGANQLSVDKSILLEMHHSEWRVERSELRPRGIVISAEIKNIHLARADGDTDRSPSLVYIDTSGGMFVNLAARSIGHGYTRESMICASRLCSLQSKLIDLLLLLLQNNNYAGRVAVRLWTATETFEQLRGGEKVDSPEHPLFQNRYHAHSGNATFSVFDERDERKDKITAMVSQLTRSWLRFPFSLDVWPDGALPTAVFGMIEPGPPSY